MANALARRNSKGINQLYFPTFVSFEYLNISEETQPYVAYSSPGKVRGKPVYVHFGQPDDFDALKSRGVTLNGTIAIMRYGKGEILAKIKRAEDNGVKGVNINQLHSISIQ